MARRSLELALCLAVRIDLAAYNSQWLAGNNAQRKRGAHHEEAWEEIVKGHELGRGVCMPSYMFVFVFV